MNEKKPDINSYCVRCEFCGNVATEPDGRAKPMHHGRYMQFIGAEAAAEFITFSEYWERVFQKISCISCAEQQKIKNQKQWDHKQEETNE